MEFVSSLLRMPSGRTSIPLGTQLIGPRLLLRAGDSEDWKAWRTMRDLSRDHLIPWEPEWPKNALSYSYYCSLLRRQWREWRNGKAYAFVIFLHGGQRPVLIGGITLGDIILAAAQKGTIGYWMGKPHCGQGLMSEAVGLLCDFAFNQLELERVEASCLPNNEPSKALLTRMGFQVEGYAKSYMQINGVREDHVLWGKINPKNQQDDK
jgi:[ribosomal protein S5]-alanine N-acetyltransferase